MSNRAAVSFLSSISLGGNQSQKKEPVLAPSSSLSQPTSSAHPAQQHHSHREHFKAKLSNTLEKKHLIHRHGNNNNTNTNNTHNNEKQITPTPATAPTSQKPAIHPNSLKRSTSSAAINNENNTSSSNLVIRSTSGTAIPNRSSSSSSSSFADIREPSPRDKSPREELTKSRNNVEQAKRDEQDYGIMRKNSDASAPPSGKARAGSTVEYGYKYSESTKGRSDSIDGGKEGRRKSTNSETNAKTLLALEEKRQESPASLANKEYRKLSKSTNDAASRSQLSSSTTSNNTPHKSISSSNVLAQKHSPRNKRDEKEKRSDLAKSPSTKVSSREKKEGSSPLKSSKTNLHDDLDIPDEPVQLRRQRRKKSKKRRSKGEGKRSKAKHNPAALDFLKGISLGENTPTLRHRKSYIGKSKLSESFPLQKSAPDVPNVSDNILFTGSASTKKIKISEYASQAPGKIYLSTRTSSTFGVFSLIKYDSKANKKDKEKNALKESMAVSTIGKTKSINSGPLVAFGKSDFQEAVTEEYDPYFLDDPSLTTGKHRTVMNLACFKESIIPYVKPGVIKEELNELFRQKHPWVPHGVTLHKIRKLKKALVPIAVAGGLEVSTIAIAYVLFERLIIKGLITKPCIRLYGCVCLVIAAKANDPHGDELKSTVEAIEKQFDIEKEEILKSEFAAFHALSYSVHPPPEHVVPHIRLIIKDHNDLVGNPY